MTLVVLSTGKNPLVSTKRFGTYFALKAEFQCNVFVND